MNTSPHCVQNLQLDQKCSVPMSGLTLHTHLEHPHNNNKKKSNDHPLAHGLIPQLLLLRVPFRREPFLSVSLPPYAPICPSSLGAVSGSCCRYSEWARWCEHLPPQDIAQLGCRGQGIGHGPVMPLVAGTTEGQGLSGLKHLGCHRSCLKTKSSIYAQLVTQCR